MTDGKNFSKAVGPIPQVRPKEADIMELVQKAAQQYEEYMKLADFAPYSETPEVNYPKYSWDNPIGLIVEE